VFKDELEEVELLDYY